MKREKIRAILIAGPTASGKSGAALAVAEKLGGTVINADSMQVYENLSVLTARPDEDDQARVPHQLYGFVPGCEPYNVGRWIDDVSHAIRDADVKGQIPIVAGGTGLYFKALLEGLSPIPDIPAGVRDHWRGRAQEQDAPDLHRELQERDPVMAAKLRTSDPQRIVRALEVIDATGRSLAEWQKETGEGVLAVHDVLPIVIGPERSHLHAKINARFDLMIKQGAIDEVEQLLALSLEANLPIMRAHGVRQIAAYLRGEQSLQDAAIQTKAETRQYAKRQFTWLRRNMIAWSWLDEQEMERLEAKIFSFIDH